MIIIIKKNNNNIDLSSWDCSCLLKDVLVIVHTSLQLLFSVLFDCFRWLVYCKYLPTVMIPISKILRCLFRVWHTFIESEHSQIIISLC